MIKDFKTYIEESRLGKILNNDFSDKVRKEDYSSMCEDIIYDNISDYVSECEKDGNELYADKDSFIEWCENCEDERLNNETIKDFFKSYVSKHWDELYTRMEEILHL